MPRRKRADAPCASCAALEAIIALQNGAMDEMGRLIEAMPGGLVAQLQTILERHGVSVNRPQRPLQ